MCCVGGERGTGSISTVKEMEKEEEELLQDLLDDSGLDSGFRYRYKQNTSDHCFSKPCTLYSDPDPTIFFRNTVQNRILAFRKHLDGSYSKVKP